MEVESVESVLILPTYVWKVSLGPHMILRKSIEPKNVYYELFRWVPHVKNARGQIVYDKPVHVVEHVVLLHKDQPAQINKEWCVED